MDKVLILLSLFLVGCVTKGVTDTHSDNFMYSAKEFCSNGGEAFKSKSVEFKCYKKGVK